MMGDNYRFY